MRTLRTYSLLTGGLLAAGLTACDFYDLDSLEPVDSVAFDLAVVDAASARTARAGLYNEMQLTDAGDEAFDAYLACWQYFSDECDWSGTFPTREEFDIYFVQPGNGTMAGIFTDFYEIVNATNLFLEAVDAAPSDGFPDELKNSLRGEARFARALAYFHLTQGWVDVPLVLTGTRAVDDALFVTPNSQTEVYDQIEEDLTFAAQNIDPAESLGITPATAQALHARVALYRESYQEALDLSTAVLGDADLTSIPYLDDEIFYLEYSSTDGNSLAFFYGPDVLNGRYSIHPSDALIASYEEGDLREELSIDTINAATPYGLKYENFDAAAGAQDDPIRLLRLSEMALIAAEASGRLGDFDAAEDFLNPVRQRAGLDNIDDLDADNLTDVILQERFVELAMDGGHRLWDARRLGRAADLFGEAYEECDDRWPFPTRELDRNPNLMQNSACNQ